jgi:hypothetical protein
MIYGEEGDIRARYSVIYDFMTGTHGPSQLKCVPKQTWHGKLNPDDPRPVPFTRAYEKPENLMTSHHRKKQT